MSEPPADFGSQLWDRYGDVSARLEFGVRLCKKMCSFMRKRAEIENDYARSIASLVKETKKTSAKYGEPTTGSLWIAFDRHVSEAGEVGAMHSEFSRKVMADIHDGLFEFYNQKGEPTIAGCKFVHIAFTEAQRSAVESRANELIRERTQAETAATKAQENFFKSDKELGFLTVERDTVLRGGNTEKAEKLSAKVEQTKIKLAQLRRDWAAAVDTCNVKVSKHYTNDMPAILRQLQIIETQRCEILAQSSLQYATMQQTLYQHALDTHWKDLVFVNTFNPLQDINAFVAFTSTGARCPPPPILGPDAVLSPPQPKQQPASAARTDDARPQPDAASRSSVSSSSTNAISPPERPPARVPPPLPPKTAAVDGKTTLARISCRVHKLELHAAQSASDNIMRGDLSPLGVNSTADVSVISLAEAGQLEPMDFKLMVLELLIDIAQSEGQQDSPFGAALLVGVPAALGIAQKRLRPLLRRMQQLVPSQATSAPVSPQKTRFKLQTLNVIEKLLEGAVSLVSQFNPADAHGDQVTISVEFWSWVRRRLLFVSATVNDIGAQQGISLQSPALQPVTSVLASLLSSIQVQPQHVSSNESIDILVLLQNLLQNFRTFAGSHDAPDMRIPLPIALLFYHSLFTAIESDEDSCRDLQVAEEVQEIGFIRLPQSWLTQDFVHVLPVVARLVAVLGLSMNEAEGLFAAALLHFLKDRPSVPALNSLVVSCAGYTKGTRSPAVSAMIAHAAAPLIICATAAWTGLLNPSGVSDADGLLLLCGDEQCIAACAGAVVGTLQCLTSEPPNVLACIADATLLIAAVTKHHNTSEMLGMWGIDALLADDVIARMSAAAAAAASAVDSSALVQWLQTMLDHVAPVAISWSIAFATASQSTTTAISSLSDLIAEVASLLPSEKLDLSDSDHAGVFHALVRAQELLRLPPERSLVAVFDAATTRCFQELSRSTQVVVQRCVQTDQFSSTAAPSIKHSSSAVDVCSAVSNVAETWQRLGLPPTATAARECRRAVAQLLTLYCNLLRQGSTMLQSLVPPVPSLSDTVTGAQSVSVVNESELPSVVSTCLRINCAVFSSDFFRKCCAGLQQQGGGVVAEEGKCVESLKSCVKDLIMFLGQKIVWIDIPELHESLYSPNAVQGPRIGPLLSGPMNEVMSCIMGNLYPQVHNSAVLSLLQAVRDVLNRVLLDGGPGRTFSTDCPHAITDDIALLKNFFAAGLDAARVDDELMGVQTLVSAIMEMDSSELIDVYSATQKVGSEEGRDYFSKETVIKVLLHRADKQAREFTKSFRSSSSGASAAASSVAAAVKKTGLFGKLMGRK